MDGFKNGVKTGTVLENREEEGHSDGSRVDARELLVPLINAKSIEEKGADKFLIVGKTNLEHVEDYLIEGH